MQTNAHNHHCANKRSFCFDQFMSIFLMIKCFLCVNIRNFCFRLVNPADWAFITLGYFNVWTWIINPPLSGFSQHCGLAASATRLGDSPRFPKMSTHKRDIVMNGTSFVNGLVSFTCEGVCTYYVQNAWGFKTVRCDIGTCRHVIWRF